jgi:long-subunit fatty acid transport protein
VNEQIQEEYEAVINARVGAEYRIEGVALRAGFAYRPDPLAEVARPVMNDGTELDRTKTFFSAGIGYRFNQQFQVDVGWMQSRFDDVYSGYPEDDLGPRQDAVLLVDEEIVRNQFALGLRYFF